MIVFDLLDGVLERDGDGILERPYYKASGGSELKKTAFTRLWRFDFFLFQGVEDSL